MPARGWHFLWYASVRLYGFTQMAIDNYFISDNYLIVNKGCEFMKELLTSVFFQAFLGAIAALLVARYILGYQI